MQILFISWLALFPFLKAPAPMPAAATELSLGKSYCHIYGAVYLERNQMYKNRTSATVFLNEDEAFANLVVFRESNKLFADGPAIWYLTPNKAFANHILYVTDQRHLADFTVHFTDVRSAAVCRD
ncbi:hypothetical protein MKJ04_08140 [Pontibacter sp. E15-1]|uniref:hypothetical protein n=1 Tax=Pontibacter sp. E15-1 TaxID=2919918 RepID=UPI001F4F8677|nr:hypothetical protein [Pontibacter sp. E15-1]MCJ8164811.1 hypothetical protein [Pontibacter sp. E15-1]